MNYNSRAKIGDVALAETCAKVAGHGKPSRFRSPSSRIHPLAMADAFPPPPRPRSVWGPKSSACATSAEGRALLRDSVLASGLLGVTKSCTILIEGEAVCVHDGTWKNCPNGHEIGDFVGQVRAGQSGHRFRGVAGERFEPLLTWSEFVCGSAAFARLNSH